MKTIGKKRQQDFIKKVSDYLEKIGAEKVKPAIEVWAAQFVINTIYGLLTVTIPKEHNTCFSIFSRFTDKDKYSKFNSDRVNKHSGKWNFHYSTEKVCFNLFEHELQKILADQYTTDILFRKWRGDIIALFPHEVCDYDGHVTSYMHVGQHGGADYKGIIRCSRPAKPEEYADLKRELENIGYRVNIVNRQNYDKYLHSYHERKY